MNISRGIVTLIAGCLCITAWTGCNSSKEYPTDGWVKKYFDSTSKLLYSRQGANYYRIAFYKDGDIVTDSLVHEYFMNDKLRAEGHIKVEFPEVDTGQCYYYDEATGGLLEKFFYGAGGKLDGEFILYYPQTGKVQTLETFRNGVQEGPSMSYYPDGTLKYSIMFVDGHEDGEVRSYYPDGSPMEKFSYNNGKLDGAYEQYFQDGDIMAKGEFKDGQKTGNWVIYSHSGRAFQENYKSHSDPDYNLVDASLTPEDAYFEGYYAGNDDGKQDASVYDPERKSFDDNSAYSGEFLKSYKSGYAVGYADGYKPKKR